MKKTFHITNKIKLGFTALLAVMLGAALGLSNLTARTAVRADTLTYSVTDGVYIYNNWLPDTEVVVVQNNVITSISIDFAFVPGYGEKYMSLNVDARAVFDNLAIQLFAGMPAATVFRGQSIFGQFGIRVSDDSGYVSLSDSGNGLYFPYNIEFTDSGGASWGKLSARLGGGVYYDLGGGYIPTGEYYSHRNAFYYAVGASVPQPLNPVRDGYAFDGWFLDSAKTIRADFYTLTSTYNGIVLYAGWLGPIPLPPDPVLAHHTFVGWFFDAAFTQPYDGSPIYANTNLYAKFALVTYTIKFVTSGATGIADKPVTALTDVGTLPTPVLKGYAFLGWYIDSDLTQPYTHISSMTGNITLYAGWEQIILTVTFYVNGSVYAEISVPYGATLSQAVSAAQSDISVISAMYSDYKQLNALSGNTVLTGDMAVYAELGAGSEKPGFFRRVGNWFSASWVWLVVCIGLAGAGVLSCYIIYKKRGGA